MIFYQISQGFSLGGPVSDSFKYFEWVFVDKAYFPHMAYNEISENLVWNCFIDFNLISQECFLGEPFLVSDSIKKNFNLLKNMFCG